MSIIGENIITSLCGGDAESSDDWNGGGGEFGWWGVRFILTEGK